MKWEDLPESQNIEDRRGEKSQPLTFQEMMNAASRVIITDRTPGDANNELAIALGVNDIANTQSNT